MISNSEYKEAYVWIWLPGETRPVVAGLLTPVGDRLLFNYGRTYLNRKDAIPIYLPELPLRPGEIPLLEGLSMPGCVRDASPDAWGRRILVNRKLARTGQDTASQELSELDCLLESGSDRTGALDFQQSAKHYEPRGTNQATLEELLQSAELVEKGLPLSPELDRALQHGTSLGGARPKAYLASHDKKYIAKFSISTDLYNIVKAEFIAMRLAALAGLSVANVHLKKALGRDVLLVERFDREHTKRGWTRKGLVSALTLFGLDEMMARHASYEDLAEIIRLRFQNFKESLRELYSRLVFNILCGNTDDHARNHAAFWDGASLNLTPAYDVCPQARTGDEATQAMLIVGNNRMSQLSVCLQAAPQFQLDKESAMAIIQHQVQTIRTHWESVCNEAELALTDRRLLWRRQFLNPFAFYDSPPEIRDVL